MGGLTVRFTGTPVRPTAARHRGEEVVGRFMWSDEGVAGVPFDVVIDGRTLTWEEFGVALITSPRVRPIPNKVGHAT